VAIIKTPLQKLQYLWNGSSVLMENFFGYRGRLLTPTALILSSFIIICKNGTSYSFGRRRCVDQRGSATERKTRHYSKTWSLTNCGLILQACLIRFLLFLVSPGSVETWLRWRDIFYNSFVEYSFLFPLMQKVYKFTKKCGSYSNLRSGVFLLPHPVHTNWANNIQKDSTF